MEGEHRQTESSPGTCAGSVITGIHFSEVCINGSSLRRIVRAVQTAMADTVEITGICSEGKYERRLAGELTSNIFQNTTVFCPENYTFIIVQSGNRAKRAIKAHNQSDFSDRKFSHPHAKKMLRAFKAHQISSNNNPPKR